MTSFTTMWGLEKPLSTTQNKTSVYNTDLDRIDEGRRFLTTAGTILPPFYLTRIASGPNVLLANNGNRPLLGFVSSSGSAVSTISSGSQVYVQVDGWITNSSWAFTPGVDIYAHPTTAGSITQTAPGSLAWAIAWAISSHQIAIRTGGFVVNS